MLKDRKRRLALERSLKERKVIFQLPFVALDCANTNADTQVHRNSLSASLQVTFMSWLSPRHRDKGQNESPSGSKPLLWKGGWGVATAATGPFWKGVRSTTAAEATVDVRRATACRAPRGQPASQQSDGGD